MKKRIAVVILIVMILSISLFAFAGCSKVDYVIGMMENTEHFSSDMVMKGFREPLDKLMSESGKTYKIKYRKSGGEVIKSGDEISYEKIDASEKENVGFMKNKGVNLIFAMSATSAAAAVEHAKNVPTVFAQAAIADRELQESELSYQVQKQVELMRLIAPDASKLGILYCDSGKGKVDYREPNNKENTGKEVKTKAEINAELQVKIATEYIESLGLEAVIVGYTKEEDKTHDTHVRSALNNLKKAGVGCVFIPVDNTLASVAIAPKLHERGNTNIYTSNNGIEEREVANMPIVCGDVQMNEFCGVATYAVDYYQMGAAAAKEVYDILVGGKDSKYSEFKTDFTKGKYVINEKIAKDIKFEIPQTIKDLVA